MKELDKQRERDVQADNPGKFQGRHWGYVRDTGDGMWYPAYVDSRDEHSGGIENYGNSVTMKYGTDLRMTPSGKYYFEDEHTKQFQMLDDEFNQKTSNVSGFNLGGKEMVDRYDIMRDWYFVPDDKISSMSMEPFAEEPINYYAEQVLSCK